MAGVAGERGWWAWAASVGGGRARQACRPNNVAHRESRQCTRQTCRRPAGRWTACSPRARRMRGQARPEASTAGPWTPACGSNAQTAVAPGCWGPTRWTGARLTHTRRRAARGGEDEGGVWGGAGQTRTSAGRAVTVSRYGKAARGPVAGRTVGTVVRRRVEPPNCRRKASSMGSGGCGRHCRPPAIW